MSLTDKSTHPNTQRVFLIAINFWVILNTSVLLPASEHFWGPDAYLKSTDWQSTSGLNSFFGWLSHPEGTQFYPALVVMQILFATLAIFKIFPVSSQILVAYATFVLDHRASVILDGGNNLIHLLLIYSVGLAVNPKISHSPHFSSLRFSISNAAFLIARLQVAAVYLCAGLSKAHGTLWPKGVALYYTMSVEEYGHPLLAELMSSYAGITVLGSYATVAFQISFPFLVWNRNLRPFILAAGTFFHLGIAFGMGLMSFGLAMCTSYFLFYTEERSRKLISFFRIKKWRFPRAA